ncbi:HAD family hydrolase [Peptoniphilus harei]|uniref:HAD family hydrolase n=1 Tax=Peptoniphilus harei TaxID=54005 RepID=UPI001896E44D|nr:HAD family hydrolase [Peptoniphilus harei]MDK7355215.1 HAD family hydrolase [Peptoniphilus harei]MDK7370844.1 HAD family hydrolase [Peptoniphilus harei]
MKRKLALYDFDKTVVDCESIVELYKYGFKNRKIKFSRTMAGLASAYIRSKLASDFNIMKNQMVSIIKYFTEDELKDFVTDYLFPKFFFVEFEDEFYSHDEDTIKILCSASATPYLKYVKDLYPFDYIIGTDLGIDYKLTRGNNKKGVKVKNIRDLLAQEGIEIDYENSSAYSDSYDDDKYMLRMTKNRFLINSKVKKKGYENLSWHTEETK